jgi:hypothetical protein
VTLSYDVIAYALGNGHGAIAFRMDDGGDASCSSDDCPRFRIGTATSESAPIDGWPTAWSLDGNLLAVVEPLSESGFARLGNDVYGAGNYFDDGWLEVLSYPSLTPVYSNKNIVVNDIDMAFSPSGRYLQLESTPDQILDLQSQTLTKAPSAWPTYWYGNDELITPDGRDLVAHSVGGNVVQRWKGAGDGPLAASADGRLAVTTDHERTPKSVTVIQDGQMSNYSFPFLVGLDDVNLVMPTPANDGRSTILMTEAPEMFGPLLALQVPSQ